VERAGASESEEQPQPQQQPQQQQPQQQQQQQQQQQRDIAIMSCAQFRPEKEHALQIDIMRLVSQKLTALGKTESELPRLMVVGGIERVEGRTGFRY
jgi:hypothetical protein